MKRVHRAALRPTPDQESLFSRHAGVPLETTPASIFVALRRKFGTCRDRRVVVSVCCLY